MEYDKHGGGIDAEIRGTIRDSKQMDFWSREIEAERNVVRLDRTQERGQRQDEKTRSMSL